MLKVLPSYISNLIAAGEVVQRPASVVKELVENSIDAGADKISIIIGDSGRTLIQVIDNGSGMSMEEGVLSFERHATSKIAEAEDLHSIITYGFRGEALASIAAVAQVTMRTRKVGEELGAEIQFAESKLVEKSEIASPEGTNIAVRNIFYNVPARRKFLKSDSSEFRQIVAETSRIAISHPEVALKLVHNDKEVLNFGCVKNLKQRLLEVAGKSMASELVDISSQSSIITIGGYIGKPEDAKKSSGAQYFFVNGRFFRSPYFHKSLVSAYDGLIPEGTIPSYFIFFEVNPEEIDINIHPAKTEVKFENESIIYEILRSAVKEAIGKNSLCPSIDFDLEGAPEIPIVHSGGERVQPPKINYDPLFDPFQAERGASELICEDRAAKSKTLMQVHGKYILTTVKSGLLMIHISRARERILYERFLKDIDNSTPISQQVLFPQNIDLDYNSYSLISENIEKILLLGFDIQPIGETSVEVCGVPDGFPSDPGYTQEAIYNLLEILSNDISTAAIKADVRENMARKLARTAVGGNYGSISDIEAQMIVDSLFACSEPDRTPDGRLCMSIITLEDLDRKI
jgi:DNA mismatch repair protein MutL